MEQHYVYRYEPAKQMLALSGNPDLSNKKQAVRRLNERDVRSRYHS
jgi:hypothetical protein